MAKQRKQCFFTKKNIRPDFKDVSLMQRYITPWGKIKEGRDTGTCAKCQRQLSTAIKRARFLAILPYSTR
ncbi:MAG TPA: 30S ribosomal protein S18 [Patescibacteria group bacterium]